MRKILIIPTLILSLTSLMAMWSCNTQGCTDNHSAIPLAGFYNSADGSSVTVDSLLIHGIGAPGDSAVAGPGTSISEVYLPMRSTRSTTSWCIAYKWASTDFEELNDTITFEYEALPYLAGDECGAMYNYHIQRVSYTTHIVDSVGISDSLITNNNLEQIQIYFRVASED